MSELTVDQKKRINNSTRVRSQSLHLTPSTRRSVSHKRVISFDEEVPEIVKMIGTRPNTTSHTNINTVSSTTLQRPGVDNIVLASKTDMIKGKSINSKLSGESRITSSGNKGNSVSQTQSVAVRHSPSEQEVRESVLYPYEDRKGQGSFYPTTSHHKLENLKALQQQSKEGSSGQKEKRHTPRSQSREQPGSDGRITPSRTVAPSKHSLNSGLHLSKPKRSLIEIRKKYNDHTENDRMRESTINTREGDKEATLNLMEEPPQILRVGSNGKKERDMADKGVRTSKDTVKQTHAVPSRNMYCATDEAAFRERSRTPSSKRKVKTIHQLSEHDGSRYDELFGGPIHSSDTKHQITSNSSTPVKIDNLSVDKTRTGSSSNYPHPLSRYHQRQQKRPIESDNDDYHISNDGHGLTDYQYTRNPSSVLSGTERNTSRDMSSSVAGVADPYDAEYPTKYDIYRGRTTEDANKPMHPHGSDRRKRGGMSASTVISDEKVKHSNKQNRVAMTNERLLQVPRQDKQAEPYLVLPTVNLSILSEAVFAVESQLLLSQSESNLNRSSPTSSAAVGGNPPRRVTDNANNISVTSSVIQRRLQSQSNSFSKQANVQDSREEIQHRSSNTVTGHSCGCGHCALDRRVIVERIALEADVRRLQGELQHARSTTSRDTVRNNVYNLTTGDYIFGHWNENSDARMYNNGTISSSRNNNQRDISLSPHEHVIIQQERHIRALETKLIQMGKMLQETNICRSISGGNRGGGSTVVRDTQQQDNGDAVPIISRSSCPNDTSGFYISREKDVNASVSMGVSKGMMETDKSVATGKGSHNHSRRISTESTLYDMKKSIVLLESQLEKTSMERDALATRLSNAQRMLGIDGHSSDSSEIAVIETDVGIRNDESFQSTDQKGVIYTPVGTSRRNNNTDAYNVPVTTHSASLPSQTRVTPQENQSATISCALHKSSSVNPNIRHHHSHHNYISVHTPEHQRLTHDFPNPTTSGITPILDIVLSVDNTLNDTDSSSILRETDKVVENHKIGYNTNKTDDIEVSPLSPSDEEPPSKRVNNPQPTAIHSYVGISVHDPIHLSVSTGTSPQDITDINIISTAHENEGRVAAESTVGTTFRKHATSNNNSVNSTVVNEEQSFDDIQSETTNTTNNTTITTQETIELSVSRCIMTDTPTDVGNANHIVPPTAPFNSFRGQPYDTLAPMPASSSQGVNVYCSTPTVSGLNVSRDGPVEAILPTTTPVNNTLYTSNVLHTPSLASGNGLTLPSNSQHNSRQNNALSDTTVLDGCHRHLGHLREELHSARNVTHQLCDKIESYQRTMFSVMERITRSNTDSRHKGDVRDTKNEGRQKETHFQHSPMQGERKIIRVYNNDNIFYNTMPSPVNEKVVSVSPDTEDIQRSQTP